MQDNILIVNNLKRAIGQLTMQVGIKEISEAISDFSDVKGDFNQFAKPFYSLPNSLPVSQLDDTYYFTSFDNWQKIIATINPILQNNGWIANRFDCDKRSYLVTSLVALLFEINTVRPIYCDVYMGGQYQFTHYANTFVDTDGNAWLWDADQQGKITKITTQNPMIDLKSYLLKSVK